MTTAPEAWTLLGTGLLLLAGGWWTAVRRRTVKPVAGTAPPRVTSPATQ